MKSRRRYAKGRPLTMSEAVPKIIDGQPVIVTWGSRVEQTVNAAWARGWSVNLLNNICRNGWCFEAVKKESA